MSNMARLKSGHIVRKMSVIRIANPKSTCEPLASFSPILIFHALTGPGWKIEARASTTTASIKIVAMAIAQILVFMFPACLFLTSATSSGCA
jgi:hypothetical protein